MNTFRKKSLLIATLITSVIYVIWRIFFTLPFNYGIIATFFGILLLIAELIGFLESANIYMGMLKIHEPEKPTILDEDFPDVDIFIATYNEPEDLLKKTINGCLNMDYPDKSKVHIYICDDGSRDNIKKLCDKMKISYIKRDDHKHAKAGNYNNALSCTSSPLIATFDADMIPMHDFLMELVPYFFLPEYEKDKNGSWKKRKKKDENLKIGFIQSPQSFYNPDLFQYNLYSENTVPNEQDFFFKQVQLSRNITNSAIYGGSNTVLSRDALNSVGGFYTESITEDLATGLLIQSNGYKGWAISSVHASGLSPTDLISLFKQRDRWARGCIQTIKKLNLFTRKGLSTGQKANYFFSVLYWYTPFRRFIFIISPILFSVFDTPVLDCTLAGILIFWIPHTLLYNATLSGLTGKIRTARHSNIYDTILFPTLLPGVFLESIGISKQKFSVTNKDKKKSQENDNNKFASKSSIIHVILLVLSVLGIVKCLYETVVYQTFGYSVILFWLIVNTYNIVMALFFIFGRTVYRNTDRFSIEEELSISFDGQNFKTKTLNISEGGAAFHLDFPTYIPYDKEIDIAITSSDNRYHCNLKATVVHVQNLGVKWRYALKFSESKEEDFLQLCCILYDRVPPMPTEVSSRSSFSKDITTNVKQRMKKSFSSNRHLPRIKLDIKLKTEEKDDVIVKNFNYEYILLETNKNLETLNILIDEKSSLKLKCRQVDFKEKGNGNTYLYYVENFKSLVYNKEFLSILHYWMFKYENKNIQEYINNSLFTDIDYTSHNITNKT